LDHAWRQPMFHQRDETGVNHTGLCGRWPPPQHLKVDHLRKRELRNQVLAQALAADEHVFAVRRRDWVVCCLGIAHMGASPELPSFSVEARAAFRVRDAAPYQTYFAEKRRV